MITNTTYVPPVWSPAYNPIMYNFVSDENQQPDFFYVIELWVQQGSTTPTAATYTLYQRPSPSGYGMVDISTIMQTFMSLANWTGGEGYSTQYRNFGPQGGFTDAQAICSVYLKVGERYIVNGILTDFNGTGGTGAPAYVVNSKVNTEPTRVFPAALPYAESVEHLSATGPYGYFEPYLMDGNGQFLSSMPLTQSIATGQTQTLSFLNWWDGGPGSYAKPIQGINVIFYNAAGSSISSTFLANNTGAGGGPQTANNYTSTTFDLPVSILSVRVGPADLTVPVNTAYYTVQAYYKDTATPSTTPQAVASEVRRFNVVNYCEDLYPVVRVSWLNELGGRDYFNFDMLYEKTTASPGDSWYQTPVKWDSIAGPYSSDADTNRVDHWIRGGAKSFGKTVTTRFVLQSDWVLQDFVDALGGIPESPSVWAYIGSTSTQPVTINVTNIDYTYSNVKQQKLVQVTLECEITKVQPKQSM